MQQTETYKLNLIEKDDTFSPDPLNQNTQKIEEVMSAETAQRAAETAALDNRVTVLEGHKVAVGSYVGNGVNPRSFTLGFAPRVVLIQRPNANPFMATQDCSFMTNGIVLTDSGFRINGSECNINIIGNTCIYLAIK